MLLQVDSQQVPSLTYVLKQIPRADLLKLIPESWVTAYEQEQTVTQNSVPVQSTESSFSKTQDGKTMITFHKPTEPSAPPCFPTQYVMDEPMPPIQYFSGTGRPIYKFQFEDRHIYWDVCNCKSCQNSESDND